MSRFPRTVYTRSAKRNGGSNGPKVVTAFFEYPVAKQLLSHPPDLRTHPELDVGDLFYNTLGIKYRCWIWIKQGGTAHWLKIDWGYAREDGLRFILTSRMLRPSWVPESRFQQREREREHVMTLSCVSSVLIACISAEVGRRVARYGMERRGGLEVRRLKDVLIP